MKSFLFSLAFSIVKVVLKSLLTNDVKKTLYEAIEVGERTGTSGQDKMEKALGYVKARGPELLKEQAETQLRTLIELTLDRII